MALAMAKLWESSSIAIIALKRGVQLTTSERMAEDIKVNLIPLLCYVTTEENMYFQYLYFIHFEVAYVIPFDIYTDLY